MSEWKVSNPIDYSPSGDDIDTAAQKVKAEFEIVYTLLNQLNQADETIKESVNEAIPDGKIGKIYSGDSESDKPPTASTYDLYYDLKEKKIYYYDGRDWQVFLSLQFVDLKNYEKYCVSRDEVAYQGENKILRLDKVTGKGNIDISGSPDKLLGYPIEVAELKDDDVLMYNATKKKFVNLPRDTYAASYSAKPGQLILVDENQTIHVNVDGSVNAIQGIPVASIKDKIKHGDVLTYCAKGKKFIVAQKDYVQEIDITETGEKKKLPRVSSDGLLHVNIAGYAMGLDEIPVKAKTAIDGDVLVYRESQGKFVTEPKGNTLGEGKSLQLYDGARMLGEYNGSRLTRIDVSTFASREIRKLEWQLAEVAMTLKEATGKKSYITDAVIEDFTGEMETIDQMSIAVTGIFDAMKAIDVATLEGIYVGGIYEITDGEHIEEIQVESVHTEDGRYRLKLKNRIQHHYAEGRATLIRSGVKRVNWLVNQSISWADIQAMSDHIEYEVDYNSGEDFYLIGCELNSNGEIVMGAGLADSVELEFKPEQDRWVRS